MEIEINLDPKIAEILSLAEKNNVRVSRVSRKQLDNISQGEVHQGVVGKVELVAKGLQADDLLERPGMFVYIREAQYEHNVGAIIRTAEAAGISGVVIAPKQKLTSTIARISMGAIFHLPVYSASLFPAIKMFKQQAMLVSALEINGNKHITEANLADPGMLIVGGEDRSISQEIAVQCDQLLKIPMFGQVNSLNMSVAAAVTIYEHVRQRQ